ncbi:MAG TPA: tRNA (guanosine(37)-N1)-methyltransferase TrmD [Acidobacteriota bacterium]|nr:tRNA (guanosine(37)-N1)-methyltransferase TrmD [Acidobacteriota bacterium]
MGRRFDIITIFPEMFPGPLTAGVIGRALERGLFSIQAYDLRDFADPPHRQVDDEPFGGGAGMVYKPEPLCRALDHVNASVRESEIVPGQVVLLSPQGRRLDHRMAQDLAAARQLTLVCGRYEGVDERVRKHRVDLELSIGDYVLTGGELAAMVLIECVVRLVPEALGDPESARRDSFVEGLLDHPHYTRPAEYAGWRVPEVLRSGNHAAVERWRRREALRNTALKRPDLLHDMELDLEDRRFVEALLDECESDRENGPPRVQ